jgi:hypothetical protein
VAKAPITDGKVEGGKISFTVQRDDFFKAVFTGTISGGDMKLTLRHHTF